MSREELLERRAKSMARSMEVEGADYKTSRRAILYADTAAFAGDLTPLKDLYRQIIIKI